MTSAQRARLRTAANLLRALIPLAALVIVVVVLTWPRGGQQGGPAIVDPGPVIDQARSMAPYTLLAPAQSGPAALPTGWRATSARIDAPGAGGAPAGAFAFRVGYLTPGGRYAQYQQSNDLPDAQLAALGPRTDSGDVQVGADAWHRGQLSTNSETVLYRTYADAVAGPAAQVTQIVTGSATLADLQLLAASLV